MRLPEPMLAKPGQLPDGPEWRFELKLDGFRAIISTKAGLRVRSRRGWDMTALVPELARRANIVKKSRTAITGTSQSRIAR